MTCHCGSCEDHRVDSYTISPECGIPSGPPPVGGSSVQSPNHKTRKSVERVIEMQEERDRYDEEYYASAEAPDPYKEWLENTNYMSVEELADRYARFGMALAEIHEMALDSFSGKDLPEPKYMLGLCLGLAGGALNYEKPKQ